MKKILLSVGLMVTSLLATAQVLNYGFEDGDTYSKSNITRLSFKEGDVQDFDNGTTRSGTKALMIQNAAVAGQNYERSVRFNQLNLEEGKSYRISFWVKGDATYTLSGTTSNSSIRGRMVMGDDTASVAVLASGNSAYDFSYTGYSQADWTKMTSLVYLTADSIQRNYFKAQNPDSTRVLAQNYFLNLNVFNPGTYYFDDIKVEEASIKGITYSNDVLKVDFGYSIDVATQTAGKDYSIYTLPNECVTVTQGGTPLDVESVELRNGTDQGFYIFLTAAIEGEGEIKVSFTNPAGDAGLKYSDAKRPGSWDPQSDSRVLDFTDEVATSGNLSVAGGGSILYQEPLFKSITPENNTFDLPLSAKTFKVVYSKMISVNDVKAKLSGPAGNINLSLAETNDSDTLTFSVPTNTTLANGSYTLTISDVYSSLGVAATLNDVLYYDFGESTSAKVDTVFKQDWVDQKGKIGDSFTPYGWKRFQSWGVSSASVTEQGKSGMSLSRTRVLGGSGSEYLASIYLATRDGSNPCRWIYGLYDSTSASPKTNARLILTAGKYNVSFRSCFWNDGGANYNSGKGVPFDFYIGGSDLATKLVSDSMILSAKGLTSSFNMKQNTSAVIVGSTLHSLTFVVPETRSYCFEYRISEGGDPGLQISSPLIVTVPSTAFAYKTKLNNALITATTMYNLVASGKYTGTAKDSLNMMIQRYTGWSSMYPSEYDAVVSQLDKAVASVVTHKALVDNYRTVYTSCKSNITTYSTNSQYVAFGQYSDLVSKLNVYDTTVVDHTSLSALKVAYDTLTYYNNRLVGKIASITPLKYRITKSVTLAESLPLRVPASMLTEAKSAVFDDDNIANNLKGILKQYVETNLAKDSIVFRADSAGTGINPLTSARWRDSIELTGFIKNPNFYTSQTSGTGLTDNTFPGWTTSGILDGNNAVYAAEGCNTYASETSPVVDSWAQFLAGGGRHVPYLKQTVTGLPAGIYSIIFRGRRGWPSGNSLTEADVYGYNYFWMTKNDVDTLKANFKSVQFNGLGTDVMISIPNVEIQENGSFTFGVTTIAHPTYTPTTSFGDPQLFMVAKLPSYTYIDAVKNTMTSKNVKEVQYYTIQGSRSARLAKGLNIVKTVYDDGSVEVQKVLIK